MGKKEREKGPLRGPQPLISERTAEEDQIRPRTIRELLAVLGIESTDNEIADEKAHKSAVLKWLRSQSRSKIQPHPVLLTQLLIRNWITDAKYDSFFPGRDRDIDLSIKNSPYYSATDV